MNKISITKFDKLTYEQKDVRSKYRCIHIKKDYQLDELIKLYPRKIERLKAMIVQIGSGEMLVPNKDEELQFLNDKIERLTDKYATTLGEIDIRKNKIYERKPIGTTYYIDLDNGNNARTGLKIEGTIDSTADETHFVDDALTGVDDYINGSYFYNVTRSLGSLITDFDAASDTVTLADAIAGMTAGDTYYILDAWLTLDQYTTTTVRTAGDIAKVRAATSQIPVADIIADEDGNVDNLITIKGCSVADDPWGDASDVKPIIDFNNTSYQFVWSSDDYWKFDTLEIKNSTDGASAIVFTLTRYITIESCSFNGSTTGGIRIDGYGPFLIKDCVFNDSGKQIYINNYGVNFFIIGCTFDNACNAGTYGIDDATTTDFWHLRIIDCSFGQTFSFTTMDISAACALSIYTRNCIFDLGIDVISRGKRIKYEDNGQVFEAHKFQTYYSTVERETTIVRAGGADSSAKLTPADMVGLYTQVCLNGLAYEGGERDFSVWLAADVEKTITIYIRGFGWTGFPTATQLFVRANYLNNGASAARTTIVSAQTISDNTTWVAFTVTLTPAKDGFVYLDAIVAHYEAASGIYVDIKPVIT